VGAYRIGGEDCWAPGGKRCFDQHHSKPAKNPIAKAINRLRRGPFHKPHYVVVQVAPVLQQESVGGVAPRPAPDPSKPVANVVMVRDLGNLRQPSAMVALSMSIVFGLVAWALHRRDKEIMALGTTAAPAAG
jgi:hypothetical protein